MDSSCGVPHEVGDCSLRETTQRRIHMSVSDRLGLETRLKSLSTIPSTLFPSAGSGQEGVVAGGRVRKGSQPSPVGVCGYPRDPWASGWEQALQFTRDKELVLLPEPLLFDTEALGDEAVFDILDHARVSASVDQRVVSG